MCICSMFQCFPKSFDIISAQSFDVSVGHYGSRVVAYHTIPMSRAGPFRQETALFVSVYQTFLHLQVHRRIHQVEERKQTTERVPKTGVGKHIAGTHFTVIGAVMHDFSFSVYLVKATWEKHGAVQAGIEGAQVINVIVFHLYLTHFTVPHVSSVRYQLVETVSAQLFEI